MDKDVLEFEQAMESHAKYLAGLINSLADGRGCCPECEELVGEEDTVCPACECELSYKGGQKLLGYLIANEIETSYLMDGNGELEGVRIKIEGNGPTTWIQTDRKRVVTLYDGGRKWWSISARACETIEGLYYEEFLSAKGVM